MFRFTYWQARSTWQWVGGVRHTRWGLSRQRGAIFAQPHTQAGNEDWVNYEKQMMQIYSTEWRNRCRKNEKERRGIVVEIRATCASVKFCGAWGITLPLLLLFGFDLKPKSEKGVFFKSDQYSTNSVKIVLCVIWMYAKTNWVKVIISLMS